MINIIVYSKPMDQLADIHGQIIAINAISNNKYLNSLVLNNSLLNQLLISYT